MIIIENCIELLKCIVTISQILNKFVFTLKIIIIKESPAWLRTNSRSFGYNKIPTLIYDKQYTQSNDISLNNIKTHADTHRTSRQQNKQKYTKNSPNDNILNLTSIHRQNLFIK